MIDLKLKKRREEDTNKNKTKKNQYSFFLNQFNLFGPFDIRQSFQIQAEVYLHYSVDLVFD